MELRVAFYTLGCKLNQLETEALIDAWRAAGNRIVEFRDATGLDLFFINTCTVTERAEIKARRLIRQVLGRRPEALVLVTGCWAQVDGEALEALDERVILVPGDEKSVLLGLAAQLGGGWRSPGDLRDTINAARGASKEDPFAYFPERYARHSRPSLKVQEGCDNHCSFCRVRLARGSSRSLSSEVVLERVRVLEESGRAEVVLTGVNLHQYYDRNGGLPKLLRTLLDGTTSIAFRLSSWEPEGIDEEFLEVFSHPRIRPHLHLPVQSGSDRILRAMARAYRRDRVIAACAALRKAKGDLFIAADLIAGFPGEGDAEFKETMELARACDLAWIHAFPFSPRPGTEALRLEPKTPVQVVEARVKALRHLAGEGRRAYTLRQVGTEVDAVLEAGCRGEYSRGHPATSENYLRLLVRDLPPPFERGRAIRCRLSSSKISSVFDSKNEASEELGEIDLEADFVGISNRERNALE